MLFHYPPQVSRNQQKSLVKDIEAWSLSNGFILQTENPYSAVHAPVTVFPSPISRSKFMQALAAQTIFNQLYIGVANNSDWLLEKLFPMLEHDDFTRSLFEIHRNASSKRTQSLTAGLFRSDYIVMKEKSEKGSRQIKQVEFNTVSVSFGGLSTKATELHRFLVNSNRTYIHGEIPRSSSLENLSKGLFEMHRNYCFANDTPNAKLQSAAVLFVVQPGETNIADQRLLEYELFNRYEVTSYRVTLLEAFDSLAINEFNRLVHLSTGREISVVYYRSGYSPSDYPSPAAWKAREFLESSHAIQCPSILTQLAGSKKIQQILTDANTISTLVPTLTNSEIKLLLKTFVKIYPLDASDLGAEGRRLAFEEPEKYVLKPQREGGGNNVYREDIPKFLKSIPSESWSAYVLMELITPSNVSNMILRQGNLFSGKVVNELGVFGVALWNIDTKETLINREAGFLLRTKLNESNEGGIAAGYGCLDAVLLPTT